MREDFARGQELGLNEDELAFYDALETNDSAVKLLGRRHPPDHCPGVSGDCQKERHHRLDGERERQGWE